MKDTDKTRHGSTRRTVLKGIGAVGAVGAAGAYSMGVGAQESTPFSIVQGDECVPISPVTYEDMSIEEFYGYSMKRTRDKAPFEANTPGNIGLPDTSYIFLYEAPDGLYLVFVHGGGETEMGGAASFEISGLPKSGEWVVRSDDYDKDPDQWNVNPKNGTATIHWSWNKYHDDGGAFGPLGEQFEFTIKPAFNGAAKLKPETPGKVADWRIISETSKGRKGISLDMAKPITVRSRPCK